MKLTVRTLSKLDSSTLGRGKSKGSVLVTVKVNVKATVHEANPTRLLARLGKNRGACEVMGRGSRQLSWELFHRQTS